ncbi:SAM-dependent DNA methyltransferase [Escherichia coli]|nr:SAM-dependent DNA methyltransferase [Escherichia coli]
MLQKALFFMEYNMSISSVIKSLQDIMRKDAGVDGDAQRLGQLSWLLFLKIFDAQEEALELEQDNYQYPIPQRYLWRSWAANAQGITGDSLLEFVNDDLFPALKNLTAPIDKNPRGYVVKQAFSDAYNYMKNGTLLRQVINKLNEIDFTSASERHLFGDIYEQILKDLQSAGNAGEFYTPRAVTRFMVDRVDPKLGESIMDPACGTGGFLACAFDHVKNKYVKSVADHQTLQQQIYGVEKKQLPHLLATTNMLLHGIEVPVQIRHDNTLNKPLSSWDEQLDVIVTNPPFGGTEEDGIEKNFPAEIDWWGNEADGFASRVENEQAWKVSIDDVIARNFNLDIKNPHQAETVSHDPDELLVQYAKQQAEIQTLRNQLRDILGAALSDKEVN